MVYQKHNPNTPTQYDVGVCSLRVLRILRQLQSRWCRVKDLATRHEVDEKTIRRDLAVIRKAGFRLRVKVEKYNRRAYRQR